MIASLADLNASDAVIYRCIYGSKAFGLDTEGSDTDIRGVFVVPHRQLFSLDPVAQIHDERQNEVYWELGRFVELLLKSNPTVLEVLAVQQQFRLLEEPSFALLEPAIFLSKTACESFAGYAETQIRKAKGLQKKLLLPNAPEKPGLLDCCHVLSGYGSISLADWLLQRGVAQEQCGLVRIPHMRDLYAVFVGDPAELRGIVSGPDAEDVSTSSVPPGRQPDAFMAFNKDEFRRACRAAADYRVWERERNESRYLTNVEAGRSYDTKNMMHVFRLIETAEDLARRGELVTLRPERSFLLDVRRGAYSYEDLVVRAEESIARIRELMIASTLPDEPDRRRALDALCEIRERAYGLSLS